MEDVEGRASALAPRGNQHINSHIFQQEATAVKGRLPSKMQFT